MAGRIEGDWAMKNAESLGRPDFESALIQAINCNFDLKVDSLIRLPRPNSDDLPTYQAELAKITNPSFLSKRLDPKPIMRDWNKFIAI